MRRSSWLAVSLVVLVAAPAAAWDRGRVAPFAVLPDGSGGPEGLEVDPHGNVYVASFGFDAAGPVSGPGRIFVFDRRGHLLRELAIAGTTNLLGLKFRASTGRLLVADFGNARVLEVDPHSGAATVFMTLPALPRPEAGASVNDITTDEAGNVYVSDSFQGIVWTVGPQGGVASVWIDDPLLRTAGVPPFGANGLRFNRAETILYVANTGSDTVVKIAITGGPPATGARAASVFVNSVNGADGLLVDRDDNLWVVANQADEVVVVDPSGRAIAKLGDFGGAIAGGAPVGLLFPASARFLGKDLLVTNLALDLRLFNPAFVSVDSPWTAEVKRYTVSRLRARLPHDDGKGDDDDHRGGKDHDED